LLEGRRVGERDLGQEPRVEPEEDRREKHVPASITAVCLIGSRAKSAHKISADAPIR
jgi:hypothetical protein